MMIQKSLLSVLNTTGVDKGENIQYDFVESIASPIFVAASPAMDIYFFNIKTTYEFLFE
ncbi:MAG: hypothetical protein M3Y53_09500 [Thermoproteota archaeon]|nr:hypothetical protein [Thermoproteota archaeon]